jgi:Protein of unknown function (DUF3987)
MTDEIDTFAEACAKADAANTDNQHSGPLHTWESPDWSILDDRRGELPKFPADCLGKAFMTVRRAARGAGVTDAHVAVPLLGIASGLVGVARRIQASRSWLEPATMWCGIVGFSGSGKTPGLEVTKRALSAIERDKRAQISEMRRKHDSKVEAARAARAAWKKGIEAAVEGGGISPEMPKEAQDPGKFIAPRLYVSDGTIERLGELLTARPQGIVRIVDELAAMFTNMQRYSGGQDNEFWLEAWNGNSYSVERIGRQLEIDHLLVGVVGGFQPDKLVKAFAGDDDGMYARFLFSWPEEALHRKLADEIGSVDENLKGALARLDALAKFTGEGDLIERSIKLSDAARAEFEQLRQFVHDQKQCLDGRDREWMSKAPAHVLRLAGTLCLLDWAWNEDGVEPSEVDALCMKRAIKLLREYFWPHARASLRLAGISERHATARRALRWIRASGLGEVSLLNIRREGLAHSLDEVGTKDLLDGLERAGWLQRAPRIAAPGPGRPARRWRVNPLLQKSDAENAGNAETRLNGCGAQPPVTISAIPAFSAPPSVPEPNGASGDGLDIPDFLDRNRRPPPSGRPATGWMTSGDAS